MTLLEFLGVAFAVLGELRDAVAVAALWSLLMDLPVHYVALGVVGFLVLRSIALRRRPMREGRQTETSGAATTIRGTRG